MCALTYSHTSSCVLSEQRRFRASGFFLPESSLQACACKNVTCQTSRIAVYSHSASFQSSFHSEATGCTGYMGGREQLSSRHREGMMSRSKI